MLFGPVRAPHGVSATTLQSVVALVGGIVSLRRGSVALTLNCRRCPPGTGHVRTRLRALPSTASSWLVYTPACSGVAEKCPGSGNESSTTGVSDVGDTVTQS